MPQNIWGAAQLQLPLLQLVPLPQVAPQRPQLVLDWKSTHLALLPLPQAQAILAGQTHAPAWQIRPLELLE